MLLVHIFQLPYFPALHATEAELFNAGLAEVGGPQWKEVLGREAEAQRFAAVAAQTADAQAAGGGAGR